MPMVSSASSDCSIVDNEALKSVIETAVEVKAMVENDDDYLKFGDTFSSKVQKEINSHALEPINFNEVKHRLDMGQDFRRRNQATKANSMRILHL